MIYKNVYNDIEIFDDIIDNILNHIDTYIKPQEFDYKLIKNADIDYPIEIGTELSWVCVIVI